MDRCKSRSSSSRTMKRMGVLYQHSVSLSLFHLQSSIFPAADGCACVCMCV